MGRHRIIQQGRAAPAEAAISLRPAFPDCSDLVHRPRRALLLCLHRLIVPLIDVYLRLSLDDQLADVHVASALYYKSEGITSGKAASLYHQDESHCPMSNHQAASAASISERAVANIAAPAAR